MQEEGGGRILKRTGVFHIIQVIFIHVYGEDRAMNKGSGDIFATDPPISLKADREISHVYYKAFPGRNVTRDIGA